MNNRVNSPASKMERSKLGRILIQISGSLLFLSLPILTSPDFGKPSLFKISPFQIDFISYALLLAFYYLNFFLLIPRYYFKRKFTLFILWNSLSYAATALLPILTTHNDDILYGKFFPYYLGQSLFKFLAVFVFSLLLKVSNKWKKAEEEKRNAELSFLKAQVNPHFLFNTLNSIYSQAIVEGAKETATGIIHLSEMMRYISSVSTQKFVDLTKELEYIRNYVELQRNRFGNTVCLNYSVEGEARGKQITPLILILFVENAFKHGVNPEEDSRIDIAIGIHHMELQLQVINNKVSTVYKEEFESGLGIENTSNRLKLIYPDRHDLQIENTSKTFSVRLKIILS